MNVMNLTCCCPNAIFSEHLTDGAGAGCKGPKR